MGTIAAPGFYAPAPLPISTTVDVMGHQSTDPNYAVTMVALLGPARSGSFGSRRSRRFANTV